MHLIAKTFIFQMFLHFKKVFAIYLYCNIKYYIYESKKGACELTHAPNLFYPRNQLLYRNNST